MVILLVEFIEKLGIDAVPGRLSGLDYRDCKGRRLQVPEVDVLKITKRPPTPGRVSIQY